MIANMIKANDEAGKKLKEAGAYLWKRMQMIWKKLPAAIPPAILVNQIKHQETKGLANNTWILMLRQ